MPDSYLTTSDVAHFNKTDMDILVSDVLDDAPFLSVLAARTVLGNTFKYSKITANPSVGFRDVNDGVENTKGTYTSVTLDLKVLDASFAVDIAAATADERGLEHMMGIEALAHMRQAMAEVEQQIFYGTGNDAKGFVGFAGQSNLNQLADAQVVGAGGSTAATGSSVYLVRTGDSDCQVLWGQQGVISIGERQIVERAGSATGRFPAFYHPIIGWCGLKVGSIYSVVRIANLTADSGKGLTDSLIAQALEKFPASRGPNYIVMNRRSHRQLQSSRTATNPTGAPAPFPSESFGVPIVVTDQIGSTETLLT
jgi:hypothetical protein